MNLVSGEPGSRRFKDRAGLAPLVHTGNQTDVLACAEPGSLQPNTSSHQFAASRNASTSGSRQPNRPYAALYEKSGFRYPLEMPYRAIHKIPNRMDAKFQVPVFMVMGEKDYAFKFPGFETAMRSGAMGSFAPDLKITYIPEGSHFVHEQLPEQVNDLLLGFLKDHPVSA